MISYEHTGSTIQYRLISGMTALLRLILPNHGRRTELDEGNYAAPRKNGHEVRNPCTIVCIEIYALNFLP